MYSTVTVQQILDRKGGEIWSVEPQTSVFDALLYMAEKNIGAVMVMDSGKLVGVFSERDYARKVVLTGKNERQTLIHEVMTEKVIVVGLYQNIDQCLVLMTDKFIRHLPVVKEDGTIAGVISIGDVVKALIAEQEFVIDQLVQYVSGGNPEPLAQGKPPQGT